jgi:hypothetical protein
LFVAAAAGAAVTTGGCVTGASVTFLDDVVDVLSLSSEDELFELELSLDELFVLELLDELSSSSSSSSVDELLFVLDLVDELSSSSSSSVDELFELEVVVDDELRSSYERAGALVAAKALADTARTIIAAARNAAVFFIISFIVLIVPFNLYSTGAAYLVCVSLNANFILFHNAGSFISPARLAL